MKYREYTNESAETRGENLETVYAKIFRVISNGGHNDHGKDILTGDPRAPFFQVKSSWFHANESLDTSIAFGKFIPVAVGDPGRATREEIIQSIMRHGGYVGIDIDDREYHLKEISNARYAVESSKRQSSRHPLP